MSILVSEIVDRYIQSASKFIKALQYLNQGHSLEIDGINYKVAETNNGFSIVQTLKVTNSIDDSFEEIVLGVPFEFFITKCSALTDDQLALMSANIVLNSK